MLFNLFKFSFYVCFQYSAWLLCGGQRLTFDVHNRNLDGVTFIGETNIVFKCCIDNSTRYTLGIEHPLGSVINESKPKADCVEYTIDEVQSSNDGEYKCTVNYTCMDGSNGSEVLTKYINVQVKDVFPQCVRNGTYGEPYKPGDWFLMSCYCRVSDACMWVLSVADSGNEATALDIHERYERRGTEILRILEHYTADTNSSSRYDCFYVDLLSTAHRCSIGPEEISQNDEVITNSSEESYVCTNSMIQTTANIQYISMSTQDSIPMGSLQNKYIIIAGGIIVLFIILIFIFLIIIICRRKLNKRDRKVNNINGNTNKAYSEDDDSSSSPYYNKGTGTLPSTSCVTVIDNGDSWNSTCRTYDDPPESTAAHTSVKHVDIRNDDYTEVSESKSRPKNITPTTINRGDKWNSISRHNHDDLPEDTVVKRSTHDVDLPNGDYAEVSESRFHPKNCEPVSGSSIQENCQPINSPKYPGVHKVGMGSDSEGENDFGKLYAKIDKPNKRGKSDTPEDFSGLYAEVNKTRKSKEYE